MKILPASTRLSADHDCVFRPGQTRPQPPKDEQRPMPAPTDRLEIKPILIDTLDERFRQPAGVRLA